MTEKLLNFALENIIVITGISILLILAIRLFIKDRMIALLTREALSFREMLEFSPDAFFVWIYDNKKNAFPMASRKLSIMLRLEKGRNTSFEEVVEKFETPEDIEMLVEGLKKDGERFVSEVKIKDKERYFSCEGSKIITFSGDELATIVWFKDISELYVRSQTNTDLINNLEQQKNYYETIIDALPFPIWLRNDGQLISDCNQKYAEVVEVLSKQEVSERHIELGQEDDVREIRALSVMARKTNQAHRGVFPIIMDSQLRDVEINETVMNGDTTIGWARKMSGREHEFENISEQKDMGFAALINSPFAVLILDAKLNVKYYNETMFKLWGLGEDFKLSFFTLEDLLRELKKLEKLPENRDFPVYKEQQLKFYNNLKEVHSDTMYLSDAVAIKRTIMPQPEGGTITYFEDVSKNLSTERSFYSLSENYRITLDNIDKSVIIFGENGRVKMANKAFLALWGVKSDDIENLLLGEVLELKRKFFDKKYDWVDVKSEMLTHITCGNTQVVSIERNDNKIIDCNSIRLIDGGIMITYSEGKAD